MRNLIDLAEQMAFPFVLDAKFLSKIQRYISLHLSDWEDDYADLKTLEEAVTNIAYRIFADGVHDTLTVFRGELRSQEEIENHAFSSLGACWSWDDRSARVVHHENGWERYGRDAEEVIFYGEVKLSEIDWVQTLAKNLVLRGEREINLRDGATIDLEGFSTLEQHQRGNYTPCEMKNVPIYNDNEF